MSTKAVAWALEQTVGSRGAKLVLLGYAEHADRHSWVAWPARSTVAQYAECEVRQAHRYHEHLVTAGLIEAARIDELPEELRRRYETIRKDRRPKLWRLNPTESRRVIPDTPHDRSRGVTNDVSFSDPRGDISGLTGCHTGSSRGVTRDTRTKRRTINRTSGVSPDGQQTRRDYLDPSDTKDLLLEHRSVETMPADQLADHVRNARRKAAVS